MAEINVRLFKDAADAISAITNSIERLCGLLAKSIGGGAEILHWSSARQLRKSMSGVHSSATNLWVGQGARLTTNINDFLKRPSEPDWDIVQQSLSQTLNSVQALSNEIARDSNLISTLPFYKDLVFGLAQREVALKPVIGAPYPNTEQEMSDLKDFLQKYTVLIDQLGALLDEIASYIAKLKAENRWPIKGD